MLRAGPGDVCDHPSAVPQRERRQVETHVTHGH